MRRGDVLRPGWGLRVGSCSRCSRWPARPPAHGIGRLWATHPPLEERIRRLERLEARLQA